MPLPDENTSLPPHDIRENLSHEPLHHDDPSHNTDAPHHYGLPELQDSSKIESPISVFRLKKNINSVVNRRKEAEKLGVRNPFDPRVDERVKIMMEEAGKSDLDRSGIITPREVDILGDVTTPTGYEKFW